MKPLAFLKPRILKWKNWDNGDFDSSRFQHANELIKHTNHIKCIETLSDTKIQVTYTMFNHEPTVLYRLLTDSDANKGRLVDAQVVAGDVSVHDILEQSTLLLKMNDALSFVMTCVQTRLYNYYARKQEMVELQDHDNVIYDAENGECLVHNPTTGRAFVLRLDPSYPLSGSLGIQVVGIEPLEDQDDLLAYQVNLLI